MITRTRSLIVLLTTLFLITPSQAQDIRSSWQPQNQPDKADAAPELIPGISNTRTARCLITVVNMDIARVVALLETSTVAGKAAVDVLGVSDPLRQDIEIHTGSLASSSEKAVRRRGGPRPSAAFVRVELPDSLKPAAEEFLAALCQNMQEELAAAAREKFDEYREKLESTAKYATRAREALENLNKQRQAILEQAGRSALSREDIEKEMVKQEREISDLNLLLVGPYARRGAIEDMIARQKEKTELQLQEDPIAQHLAEMVELRQGEVNRLQQILEAAPATRAQPVPKGLQKKIDLAYSAAELSHVINEIKEDTGMSFLISWEELELAEIFPTTTVRLQVEQITAGKALKYVLAQVSVGKFDRATYRVDDEGIVVISTESVLGDASAAAEAADTAKMLTEARITLAQAKLELAQRHQEIKDSMSSDLTAWNARLATDAMEIAERESHLQFAGAQLSEMKSKRLFVLADQLEILTQDLKSARDTYKNAILDVKYRQKKLDSWTPPKVTVMGAR